MRRADRIKGAVIASVVASMFAAGQAAAGGAPKQAPKTVKCAGINACKGQGACSAAGHDCGGHNACKGKGWLPVGSAKECTDKGGKVLP